MQAGIPQFKHEFVDSLPGDQSREAGSRHVRGACYSLVEPFPVKSPQLVAWSDSLAEKFGLARPPVQGAFADLLGGNLVAPHMKPYAACYGGHQFGHWAGQLGDGRAIGLGELPDKAGKTWEFQLKGAGQTPFSRKADGRAVLRSSIREFVCSEAMHNLGVPTTRALSVVTTGEQVLRDMFYDGNAKNEPGAIVCRVAPSFIRFGNFEIFASREETAVLCRLADYVVTRYFPELGAPSPEVYVQWFREVCRRTAVMVAHWMRVGFVHGVMNTDNMSILGLTIDYGPYGWLDDFDAAWTPNTTDLPGRRYCFGRQPPIALWNLDRLSYALTPLAPPAELGVALGEFEKEYQTQFMAMMAGKLGLSRLEESDLPLLTALDELLHSGETDMTLFFRGLADFDLSGEWQGAPEFLLESFYASPPAELVAGWKDWFAGYRLRVLRDQPDMVARTAAMNLVNPIYVPRNYLLQEAIDKAEAGDFTGVDELMTVLANPYSVQPGREKFAQKRPDWARNRPGCSTLSCSS